MNAKIGSGQSVDRHLWIFFNPLVWLVFILFTELGYADPSAGIDDGNPVRSLKLRAPRNFGYVIGDEIEHEITIIVAKPYYLESEFLPKPGLLTDGLHIRQILIEQHATQQTTKYRIHIRYLLLFGGKQPERIMSIPAIPFRLYDGRRSASATIPKWTFVYSPLIPYQTKDEEVSIRPAVNPPLLDTSIPKTGLWVLASFIAILLAIIAWQKNLLPFLDSGQSPFKQACIDLKQRRTAQPASEGYRNALLDVHRALNQTAGETLFADHLTEFFDRNPEFSRLHASTELFFRISRQSFFEQPEMIDLKQYPVQWLENLCQQFRNIERVQ